MDFNNPSKYGIPMTALEDLLDGIPSRRKLLIIDACNSGEAYADILEETIIEAKNNEKNGEIKSRGFIKPISNSRIKFSTARSLMERLFPDVRRGTGALIISASGAKEFALESDAWQNGVFTYCLLNGIKSLKADVNKDGSLYMRELKEYVYDEVPKLTNGQQNPTSRLDNIRLDVKIK